MSNSNSALLSRQEQSNQVTAVIRIGQILLKKRYISLSQLETAIALQNACAKRLGEILIEQGFLYPHQLEEALKEQKWRSQGFWVI